MVKSKLRNGILANPLPPKKNVFIDIQKRLKKHMNVLTLKMENGK